MGHKGSETSAFAAPMLDNFRQLRDHFRDVSPGEEIGPADVAAGQSVGRARSLKPMSDLESVTKRVAALSPAKRALLERRMHNRHRGPAPITGRRRSTDKPLPLSFGQQRLWFFNELEPDSFTYNDSFGLRFRGLLDLESM